MSQSESTRVRLRDVARTAQVSISTASMALTGHPAVSPDTRRRVRTVSAKLGYRKSRGRARRSDAGANDVQRVGLFLVGARLEAGPNASAVLLGHYMATATARGFRMEVGAVEDAADRQGVQAGLARFADGLDGLLLSGLIRPEDVALVSEAMRVPCAVLGQVVAEPDPSWALGETTIQRIAPDDIAMGRRAAAWLIGRGHRRIAFVCDEIFRGFCHERWLSGYRLAHLDAGLTPDPALFHPSTTVPGAMADAVRSFDRLADPPDGFIAMDPHTAIALIEALQAANRSPAPGSIVVHTVLSAARRFHLHHLPLIGPDIRKMAEFSLSHLLYLREHPPTAALEILVPMVTHNLD
jgi:LacI family transcriptional regulator